MARRMMATAAAVLVLVGLSIGQASAAEVVLWGSDTNKPLNPTNFNADQFHIKVNGVPFFVLRTAAAGYTLAQRGEIVEIRIVEALSRREVAPVTISLIRGKPTIDVGNVRIVTVYPRDAKADGAKDMMSLAKQWAGFLAKGLPVVVPGGFKPGVK